MYDQIKPYVAVGVGIDPTAADDVTNVSASTLPLSNPRQLFDAKYFMAEGLATYEGDGIPTSISAGMVAPPEGPLDELNTAIWSKGLSDANGDISFSVGVVLSAPHTSAFSLYFDGQEAQGQVTFSKAGAGVGSVSFATTDGRWADSTVRTFDAATIAVTHISRPYHHVRLVEVEFGASRTFGEDEITGTIGLIRQVDPYMASMPVDELDFELINIEGDYDMDNPNTRIGEIALGTPVYLSLTTIENGVQTTTRMGKYYICAHDGGDDNLRITAQDNRSIMQDLYPRLALSTTRPIAESISDVFASYNVPHTVDEDVAGIYPNANYTYDDGYSLLECLLHILQKWDIYCVPDVDGLMHITRYGTEVEANPAITSEFLMKFPYISKNVSYNYVRIKHDTGYYDKDLRDDPQKPMLILNIDNPLINTEAEAVTLAERVAGYVLANAEQVELYSIGMPELRLRGKTVIEGRWANREYSVSSIDMTFNGGLDMVVRGGRA